MNGCSISLLADQMISRDVRDNLRSHGYDILAVSDLGMSAADDSEIMARAIKENRILVTLDEHFGDWAVLPLKQHPGVIRIKTNPTTSENIEKLLLPFLKKHSEASFQNKLVIVSVRNISWVVTGQDL